MTRKALFYQKWYRKQANNCFYWNFYVFNIEVVANLEFNEEINDFPKDDV